MGLAKVATGLALSGLDESHGLVLILTKLHLCPPPGAD
jgi:hypothetical protein